MPEKSTKATANIGVVGLAVMGSNLARNLASRDGNTVAIYNRTFAKTQTLMDEHPEAGFVASEDIKDFVASLEKPRAALIMVQAGAGTDAVIDELSELFEPGDIIIDGGNSLFTDTIRREKAAREKGLNFVGMGVSGGEEGALKGPSLMPGGSAEAYEKLGPILESIAAIAEGEPCVTHVGTDGAGHFVKMIHNGIEYADMQLIAEAYDLIRHGTGATPAEIADIFAEWNKGELESYLIEITAEVLRQVDAATGKPLVDVILDQAGSQGHRASGRCRTRSASASRCRASRKRCSRGRCRRSRTQRDGRGRPARAGQAVDRRQTRQQFVEDVRRALYASKMIAYSQGFDAIVAGAEEYNWDIKKGNIAKIWRGGCIIRAQFLNRITEAYEDEPGTRRAAHGSVLHGCDRGRTGFVANRRRPRGDGRHPDARVLVVARLLRRHPREATARSTHPGPARLLRRPHLPAHRQAGYLTTRCGRATRSEDQRHEGFGSTTPRAGSCAERPKAPQGRAAPYRYKQ